VATGHYARLAAGEGGAPSLLRGVDAAKDQTYFLASVRAAALRRVLFPVGHLQVGGGRAGNRRQSCGAIAVCLARYSAAVPATHLCQLGMPHVSLPLTPSLSSATLPQKVEVRRIAAEAGLAPADKRSSAGICFIGQRCCPAAQHARGSTAERRFSSRVAAYGQSSSRDARQDAPPCLPPCRRAGRRNFGAFLSQYIPPIPGRYVDVDSGAELGPCPDLAAVTNGQRPGIGGAPERVYAVGKDVVR
jgi:tRNA-specific 2-thiouridylase